MSYHNHIFYGLRFIRYIRSDQCIFSRLYLFDTEISVYIRYSSDCRSFDRDSGTDQWFLEFSICHGSADNTRLCPGRQHKKTSKQ